MLTPDEMRAAIKAAGYTVKTTLDGRTANQTFASKASLEAYVARAIRTGATVQIIQSE